MKCPSCKNEVMAGTRWCALCHANVVDPTVGRLASPFKRLAAYVFEGIIIVGVFFLSVGTAAFGAGNDGVQPSAVLGMMILLAYVVVAVYLFTQGTTPGKRVLGMWVVKEDGSRANLLTMLMRELIGKQISLMIFSIGFLWILIDDNKQGWHDKLMSTYVVDDVPVSGEAGA